MNRHRTPQAREAARWERLNPGWRCEHRNGVYYAAKVNAAGHPVAPPINAPTLHTLDHYVRRAEANDLALTRELADLIRTHQTTPA